MTAKRVYVIGVSHEYQLEGYGSDWTKFHSLLRRFVKDKCVDLIAEELSKEAISCWQANGSVARNVASELRIKHLFCDPDSSQRQRLGIKNKEQIEEELGYEGVKTPDQCEEVEAIVRMYWPKREAYWLDCLFEEDFKRGIFILGADHLDRFCKLLDQEQVKYEIIAKDWHPSRS